MIRFSEEYLFDRIYACWLGKNIGGTIGGPYEGTKEMLDVRGFQTKPGDPLPNDDLDLQLLWLRAVDELGPEAVNAQALGEYWTAWVGPDWNEYGVCKANLREGFLPPLSGELANSLWRNSNGAWIRTEVWACLCPLRVEEAIRLAYEDACVDHGYGEGTWAAIFIAAMESAAFGIADLRQLIEIGLSKIPEDCRVARSVRIVLEGYEKGADWRDVRRRLVEDSEDLGWFQAPANIGYVILGLLYGGCDFKQSMLLAVNCGDDTDCTAATVGALLGILQGTAGIPADWRDYIGDEIKTCCLRFGHGLFPETCTALTQAVMNLLPVTLRTRNERFFEGEELFRVGSENDFSTLDPEALKGRDFAEGLRTRKPYSFTVENLCVRALVEFDHEPTLRPLGELTGRLSLTYNPKIPESKHYHLRWILPDGWSVDCRQNLYHGRGYASDGELAETDFAIRAGEEVPPHSRIILEIEPAGHTPLYVPIVIAG